VRASDPVLIGWVFVAIAGVLAAPLVGRVGYPTLANLLVALAALAGSAAFVLAALQSVAASRRAQPPRGDAEC